MKLEFFVQFVCVFAIVFAGMANPAAGQAVTDISGTVFSGVKVWGPIQVVNGDANKTMMGDGSSITLPSIPTVYFSGSLQSNTKTAKFKATAASGNGQVVVYLTQNGQVGGTPIFSSVDTITPFINDGVPTTLKNYNYGYSLSGVTLTVKAQQATFVNVGLLSLTILQSPSNVPDGTEIQITVSGN